MRRPTTTQVLCVSFALQLGLILYAQHVDSHPERYGGLKYTDVDWRVVLDGARLIFRPADEQLAEGWMVRVLGWRVGEWVAVVDPSGAHEAVPIAGRHSGTLHSCRCSSRRPSCTPCSDALFSSSSH